MFVCMHASKHARKDMYVHAYMPYLSACKLLQASTDLGPVSHACQTHRHAVTSIDEQANAMRGYYMLEWYCTVGVIVKSKVRCEDL